MEPITIADDASTLQFMQEREPELISGPNAILATVAASPAFVPSASSWPQSFPSVTSSPISPTQLEEGSASSSEREAAADERSLDNEDEGRGGCDLTIAASSLPASSNAFALAEPSAGAADGASEREVGVSESTMPSASAEIVADEKHAEFLAPVSPGLSAFVRDRSPYRRPTKWGRCGIAICRAAMRPCFPRGGGFAFLGCSKFKESDPNACRYTCAIPEVLAQELPVRVFRRVPLRH
jgi:hypothetical protein